MTAKPDKITIDRGKYACYVRLHHGAQSDTWRKGPYKRERAFVSPETAIEHARRAFPGVPIVESNRRSRKNFTSRNREGLTFEQWAREAGVFGRSTPGAHGAWALGKSPTSWGRVHAKTVVANRRSRRNSDTSVGNIIAEQLGGVGRLRLMLNAKNIYAIANGLQFSFAGRRETGNKCVIKLEPSDTYRVEFWWVRGAKAVLVKAFDDIYAEQLMDIFEKQTGLYLTMHPRRNKKRRTSRKAKRTSRRSR